MKEKILYWTPRILTFLAFMFMLMFSFDAFEGNAPFLKKLAGFFMHSIPALIFGIILLIAWFREFEGGILIIAAAITACILFKSFTTNKGSLVIFVPFIVTGLLFLLHHMLYRKKGV